MAGLFGLKEKKTQRLLERRFGFVSVQPVFNSSGEEKFGIIELTPEYGARLFSAPGRKALKSRYFTAALRLAGAQLNLFLSDERQESDFWSALSRTLPNDSPTQVLLRRRRGELGQHYQAWQEKVQNRLGDAEVAYFFLQDYLDNLVYPVEECGLTDDWVGIFVSGRSEEELGDRLALLMTALPCESTPCSATELSRLLLDYYAPSLAEEVQEQGDSSTELYPDWLAESVPEIGEGEVFTNGTTLSFWGLSALPPQVEGGWTRPLLESQVLATAEFDLVVHLAPAPADERLVEVLNRRLAAVEQDTSVARAEGNKRAVREFAERRREIEARLEAIFNGQEIYYEVGLNLALRSTAEDEETLENEQLTFKRELNELGFAPRRLAGFEKIEQALLSCAPLNLGQTPRSFVLPARAAGRLALVAGEGLPESNFSQPLAGLTAAGQPIFFDPARRPGESALFFLGNPGKSSVPAARALVQYLSAMRYISGSPIFGLDPTGEWAGSVRQLGGQYFALGPEKSMSFGWNPLCVPAERLNDLNTLGSWVNETAEYLGKLLELNPIDLQGLNPLLLECVIESVSQNATLSAELLCHKAQFGGYKHLAERLAEIGKGGRYHWLFAAPTCLPLPGHTGDLSFIGFSPRALVEVNAETRQYYLNRFFTAWVAQLARYSASIQAARFSKPPFLLILDDSQQFLAQPDSANALLWLSHNATALGLSLWALSPRCDEWLTSNCGQRLLDTSSWQCFFNQNGAGLAGVSRRLALPQRALKIIRELEPGAALLRRLDGSMTELLPLPCDYVTRLIPAKRPQIAAPAKETLPASSPATATGTTSDTTQIKRPLVPEPLTGTTKPEKKPVPPTEQAEPEKEPVYIFANAKRGA